MTVPPEDRDRHHGRVQVLDGIRGVAILLVLFHHIVIFSGITKEAYVDKALRTLGNASWVGVDLFFVLSGFLITGILLDAKGSPTYFSSFYIRRILRIFPLYYGVLFLTFVLAPVAMPDEMAVQWTAGQGWYWMYLSNVQVAMSGWQPPLYIGHFWSLAVEEQFYLLWPLVVASFDRRRLMQIALACFAAAFVLRVLVLRELTPLAGYVLMPTRMDTLAAGAMLALAIRGRSDLYLRAGVAFAVAVFGAITAAALLVWRRGLNELDPVIYLAGYSIFAVMFAALIALALSVSERSPVRRLLCVPPLLLLGQYSYGLYVFHQPIALAMQRQGWSVDVLPRLWGSQLPGLLVFGIGVLAASALCAAVSWHAWEMPFLRLKRHFPYHPSGSVRPAENGVLPAA